MSNNLQLKAGGLAFDVRRFSVREELSGHFHIAVWARHGDHNIDPETLIGSTATFSAEQSRTGRTWQAGVKHMELVRPEPGKRSLSTYMLELVSPLWFTTQVRQRRIFQHLPLPDIIEAVLAPYGLTPKRELGGEYPDHEYIVQHGESDYEFVNRLMEQAGITYFYRFGDETELVIADKPVDNGKRAEAIHYVEEPTPDARQDYVTSVRIAHRVRPGRATVRDFDFRRKPDFPLWEEKKADEWNDYEHYHYLPGSFLVERGGTGGDPSDDEGIARHETKEGQLKAARILAGLRRGRRSVGFVSNALDLAPGVVFCIERHPHSELDDSTKLLVNEVTLDGSPTGDWLLTAQATFCDDGHQPTQKSKKGLVHGLQSAITTGPGNEEIYTDEFGRVRAQFQWDRGGKGISAGEAATKWLRVSQPWAGRRHGAMFLPRVGHELLVRHYEGDPEMPAVVGRVHNKLQPVPYPLPKHEVKAVWKTDTTPHQENSYNEIRLDDRKDLELFYTQAQRDRLELVQRHEYERTGVNRVDVTGKKRWTVVGEKHNTMVGKTYSIQMVDPPSEDDLRIMSQRMPKLLPQPTKLTMQNKKFIATTRGATLEIDDKEIIFEAKGEISVKGMTVIIEGGPKVKINCGSSHSGKVAGAPGKIALTADGKEKGEFTHVAETLQKKARPKPTYEVSWPGGKPTRTAPKDVPPSDDDDRNFFVALAVPDGPYRQRLIEDAPADLGFHHPDDLHMTVAFLGKIGEEAALAAFDEVVGAVDAPPIAATLDTVKVLGRNGTQVTLIPSDGNEEAAALMSAIKDPLELASGREPSERAPLPHVTVAEPLVSASKRKEAAVAWAQNASPTPAPMTIDTVGLYVRNKGPGKPAYTLVKSKKLTG